MYCSRILLDTMPGVEPAQVSVRRNGAPHRDPPEPGRSIDHRQTAGSGMPAPPARRTVSPPCEEITHPVGGVQRDRLRPRGRGSSSAPRFERSGHQLGDLTEHRSGFPVSGAAWTGTRTRAVGPFRFNSGALEHQVVHVEVLRRRSHRRLSRCLLLA